MYKYGSCQHLEWLKPIILQHKLYFPTPRELNDPIEARPPLTSASIGRLIETLIELNAKCKPFLSNKGLATDARIIAFNGRRFGPKILLDSIARSLYPQLETFHIYSLSKRPDNRYLWERYAKGHTGYCLEFRNEGSFRRAVFEVRYGDIALDITDREQIRPFLLFYKAQSWSKEEEIRMIAHRSPNATQHFDPPVLTRLILGQEVAPMNAAKIREWASERDPPLTIVNETEIPAAVAKP